MKVLAIDTSTNICSLAVNIDGHTAAEDATPVKAGHSGTLLPNIDKLLCRCEIAAKDIDMIAVGLGPGSFTGIRIGLATAKGLATALQCRLTGFCTLDIMAFAAIPAQTPVMPLIDARKGEVFCAVYDSNGSRRAEPVNIKPQAAAELIKEPTLLLGNGLEPYGQTIIEAAGDRAILAPQAIWAPRAAILAQMAVSTENQPDFNTIQPIYVRPSDAILALKNT